MSDDTWNPERAAAGRRNADARFIAESGAITAANLIITCEATQTSPLAKARCLRQKLQTLGNWDLVEDVLHTLLRGQQD